MAEIKDYASNSHKSKQEIERVQKEKVIAGTAILNVTPKKTFLGELFADGTKDITNYIVWDVVIPALKTGLRNVSYGIIDAIFGKGSQPQNRNPYSSTVSYTNYSKPSGYIYKPDRASISFDDVIVETRGEAEQIIDTLDEAADRYGQVTVADLYEFVGLPIKYTHFNYGWVKQDLRLVRIERVNNGYVIAMPKVRPL